MIHEFDWNSKVNIHGGRLGKVFVALVERSAKLLKANGV